MEAIYEAVKALFSLGFLISGVSVIVIAVILIVDEVRRVFGEEWEE